MGIGGRSVLGGFSGSEVAVTSEGLILLNR